MGTALSLVISVSQSGAKRMSFDYSSLHKNRPPEGTAGVSGVSNAALSEPKNPNLHQMATETLRHLDAAHDEADRLGGNLFGEGGAKPGVPAATSVNGIMSRCSELAAGLVGYLRSLNERAGSRLPNEAEPFDFTGGATDTKAFSFDTDEILRCGECVTDSQQRVFELVDASVFASRACATALISEHVKLTVGASVNLPVFLRKPPTFERDDNAGFLGHMQFIRRA
jgi:hypothetical protein